MSARTLFTNARVLDCTGPGGAFDGEVLVEGDKIAAVGREPVARSADTRVVDLGGSTLMPGLGDAHVHFGQDLDFEYDFTAAMSAPPEDAALGSAGVARRYVECGITTCVSGGIAQARGDVALKDVIDRGWVTGPRIIPGGQMISDPEGIWAPVMPQSAAEMREAVREQCDLGVRTIKLFLSGENVMPPGAPAVAVDATFMNEGLVSAAVEEAARHGAFVHTHARGAGSVKLAARCGARLISHASYVDDEGLELLLSRDDVWVCPGLHYLYAMPYLAPEPYATMAKEGGYDREYEDAADTLGKLAEAGVKILPGGDYGHTWIPHGEAARDLQHFVERVGIAPEQALLSATSEFGPLTGMKVGQVAPGYFADLLILDGDPLEDITILQNQNKRRAVFKGGELAWVNADRLDRF